MLLKMSRLSFYCGAALLCLLNNNTFAGQTTQIDIYPNGKSAHGNMFSSIWPEKYSQISANGRFVVFLSSDSDLVSGGIDNTSTSYNVYVSDLLTHKIERASFFKNEILGTNVPYSSLSSISADGRYVAFESRLDVDTNNSSNGIFVRDILTNKIEQIANNGNTPIFSGDGRHVVFSSYGSNLVPNDTNGKDIFIYDRITHKTERVSVASGGIQIEGESYFPSISADGRYVTFTVNIFSDRIFVHDRLTKNTHFVGKGQYSEISADGRYITFFSDHKILIYDHKTQKIEKISSNIIKKKGAFDDINKKPMLSSDGRYITFSWTDDQPGNDIYIYDRVTHKPEKANVELKNIQNGYSFNSSISADGRYVAFDYNEHFFVRDRFLNTKQKSDLKISATKKPVQIKLNASGNYLFTITNNGPNIADNINLTHLVSNGNIISFKPSQGKCNISPMQTVCSLGKLAAGKSLTLNSVIKAFEGKSKNISQQLNVNAAPLDTALGNNSLSISTPIK